MMNTDQSTVIFPDDPDEHFLESIQTSDHLAKIEATLLLPSPSEGFRDWLIKVLWRFYCTNGAHVGNSRAIFKRELLESARLATKLKISARRLWYSGEAAVLESLDGLVGWQAWQSSQPMHASGIPLIALLDEFAKRIGQIADKLPDDAGGPRQKQAFNHLLISLSDYYRALMRDRQQPIKGPDYFKFAAAVKDMLLKTSERLPTLKNGVPSNDPALRRQLYRLNAERRRVGRAA
jgi:hypothetical protein